MRRNFSKHSFQLLWTRTMKSCLGRLPCRWYCTC
jgi:hypothetical protein